MTFSATATASVQIQEDIKTNKRLTLFMQDKTMLKFSAL